ncbi:unnamed protein product [Lupinus luteus]|uniref:Uncharacterized protein n=1 Tax=Lupinus luteus TaxID=3873 RepID=A0AAV1VQF1_LUPLU
MKKAGKESKESSPAIDTDLAVTEDDESLKGKADTVIEDDESLHDDTTTSISLAEYLENMYFWDLLKTIEEEKVSVLVSQRREMEISIHTYVDAINFAYSTESNATIMQNENSRAELDSFKEGIDQLSKTFKRKKSLENKHEALCGVIKDIISRQAQIELVLKELKVEVAVKDLEDSEKEEIKEHN